MVGAGGHDAIRLLRKQRGLDPGFRHLKHEDRLSGSIVELGDVLGFQSDHFQFPMDCRHLLIGFLLGFALLCIGAHLDDGIRCEVVTYGWMLGHAGRL